ncbi:LamG-like jellyroll fold domain-containing protein [Candidatus Nanosalina sp. VS9-1]|uniref:LamG domain-containing protein n=1 Tax=Candidatus Nanosalina sp. VS9-1 TaxID=3388566 RepID=UPI0039E15A95
MVRWNSEELTRRDSTGVTDDTEDSLSAGLQQGYELGSLTDGLVAYYPFDGTVEDKALDNNGTDNTSAGYVSGKIGDAKDFDGSSYVSFSSRGFLQGLGASASDDYSYVLWVKTTSTGYIISDRQSGTAGTRRAEIGFNSDGTVDYNWGTMDGSVTVNDGNWHQIALVARGTELTGYVDASQDATGTRENDTSNSNTKYIGARVKDDGSLSDRLNGQIDDVRIYDRVLSTAEVEALYQRTSTQNITDQDRLTSGLVGHWPLNEDSAGKAYDLSGNNFDSTSVTGTSTAVGLGGAKARSFDSANNEEVQLDTSALSLSTYTISFWANTENLSADGTNGDYLFDSPDNSDRVYIYDSATDKIQSPWGDGLMPVSEWENNSWNLVTLVNHGTGNDVDFYYNGQKKNTLTDAGITLSPEFISLGGYNYEHLDGKISDFRIYNRPLTQSEIQKIVEMGGLDV